MIKSKRRPPKKIHLIFLQSILIISIMLMLIILTNTEIIKADDKIIGAHRGNSLKYMENTIPAFEDATYNDKYKFIEFDIQYTKDKKIVVYHDLSLFRLQKKLNKIQDLTYKELLEISNFHIPLYSEVMNIINGKKPVNIEIKTQGNLEDDKKLVDEIVADLKNRGLNENTLLSSISSDVINYIKEKYPDFKTGKVIFITTSTILHYDRFTSELYKEIDRIKADYIMLHGLNLENYDSLKKLLPKDKTLVIWYLTDEVSIVYPKNNHLIYKLKNPFNEVETSIKFSPSKECIWWC